MFVNYIIKRIKKKNKNGYITSSGRNFAGIICVQHKGGGLKKNVYNIDFFRRLNNYGIVFKIFKVSFYSSFIGLILYQNGLSSYILLSNNVIIGDLIYSGTLLKKENKKEKILLGFALPLFYMNLLSMIHNIELYPFSGSSLMRAAGTSTFITTKYKHKVSLKLKSGWNVVVSKNSICSVGCVANPQHQFYNYKKAGFKRNLGIRPTVRGVAKNPCDHPHGGGEGRKSPPVAARSPWGWLTKGTPTKKKKYELIKKKKYKIIRKN